MELNQEFLLETFFSYCKRPLHKKFQNVYNAECPICKEGKSAGRSRRLFYFPNKDYFYCHNCSKSWKPIEWIKEVTGWVFFEIVRKNNEKLSNGRQTVSSNNQTHQQELPKFISDLPENAIDLTNEAELSFYKDNKYVKLALEYCHSRRLFTAVNSCKRFYISLDDKTHKNRLVIPFYAESGKADCYQTRALDKRQFPKYLTKFGEKSLFGLTNVNTDIPYVFVFEGPIDSMFVKNGVAMASLSPTEKQTNELNSLIGYETIWVFDNDKNNTQTFEKISKHINSGKRVFIWPKEFYKYKDFNEVCCKIDVDEIPWKFVVKNSAVGKEALIKQKLVYS